MYHTCLSSTLSLRCKATFSYSFNGHSYFQYDRFDRHPLLSSSQSCCACCCSNYSVQRVPVKPNVLCGFRQSALIQWSPSRRVVFGAGDRCCCPSPAQDVGRGCCCGGHKCNNIKDRSVSGGRGRWGEGRFRRMASESKQNRQHLRKFDDVEAILSLLVEEVDEECFSVRERFGNHDCFSRIDVEKGDSCDAISYQKKKKKKNVGSRLLESDSKSHFKSARSNLRIEDGRENEYKKKKDGINVSRKEKRRGRKSASSCSSYHSCGSLGEFEIDSEVQLTQEGYGKQSASRFERDEEETGVLTHEDVAEVMAVSTNQDKIEAGSYTRLSAVDLECRKKSEKKLTEVSTSEMESLEKSSQSHKTVADIHGTGQRQSSSSHQNLVDIQRKSNLASSAAGGIIEKACKKGDQITGQSESRMKYKHFTGAQESNMDNESIASFRKQNSGRENRATGAGSSVQETRHDSTEADEINITLSSTSNRQFEARVRKHEESMATVSSVQGQVKGSNKIDAGRKLEQRTEASAPVGLSDIRMKKQFDDATYIFGASAEAKDQLSPTNKQAFRQKDNKSGAQNMGRASVVHSVASQSMEMQLISGKRTSSEETTVNKSTQETLLRETRERISQIGLLNDTTTSSKSRASSSHSSSILETQSAAHNTGVVIGDHAISQSVLVPPPSQFVARRPLHPEPTNNFQIQEISSSILGAASESPYASAELNTTGSQHRKCEAHDKPLIFPSDEDAIGSAGRLEGSSAAFVGKFLQKATHEASHSKSQEERTSLVLGGTGHEHYQQTLSGDGSGDWNSKKQDSRRSSRSSGAKGPSEEIWDVPDQSIHVPAGTEAAESSSPTISTVSRRPSRSVWNVLSDIVRLRWASNSESHPSTRRSGARSSPNQSTASEAWFSGHELDGSSDGKVKSKATSVSHESENQQLITNNSGGQESGSSSSVSKQKTAHVGMDAVTTSSPGISGSGPAFKSISSQATDGSLEESGTGAVESSVPVTSLRLQRSPHVDGISGAGKTDLTANTSGSIVQEQVVGSPLTEPSVTEGRGEELKRRKFQRTTQVVKDRFDEWEEAYMLETEQRKADEMFMREALLEAKKAGDSWEVPVGAVLVQHGKIIARGYNLVEELRDSTAHAEMICIREASNQLRTWRLSDTTLYITLEPCPMCAGAILQARIDCVVWGAPNKLLGADGSWIRLFPNGGEGGGSGLDVIDKPPPPVHPFHPKMTVRRGILAAECADTMQEFFRLRRRKKKTTPDPDPNPPPLPVSHHPSKFLSKMQQAFHIMFCL